MKFDANAFSTIEVIPKGADDQLVAEIQRLKMELTKTKEESEKLQKSVDKNKFVRHYYDAAIRYRASDRCKSFIDDCDEYGYLYVDADNVVKLLVDFLEWRDEQ